MFGDYEELVLADYHQKRLANALRSRLIYPTPGKLKAECIFVLNERYSVKDNKILSDFFDLEIGQEISEQVIKRFDRDKFKPLYNFLNDPGIKTASKNVELLAWLIDFNPRPHELGRKYKPNDPGQASKEKIIPQPVYSGKPYFNYKSIVVLAVILIVLIGSAMAYWLLDRKNSKTDLTGHERCMYWTGDRYVQISCSQKVEDKLVVALDSVRLVNLMRITNTDTITEGSIGKVWYIKRGGTLEYYTYGGMHPEDPQLRLRPITSYIINKYIRRNE